MARPSAAVVCGGLGGDIPGDYVEAALSAAAKEAVARIPQNYEFQEEGLRKGWHGGEAKGVIAREALAEHERD